MNAGDFFTISKLFDIEHFVVIKENKKNPVK